MTISLILNDKQISNKVGFLSTNQFSFFFLKGSFLSPLQKRDIFSKKPMGGHLAIGESGVVVVIQFFFPS